MSHRLEREYISTSENCIVTIGNKNVSTGWRFVSMGDKFCILWVEGVYIFFQVNQMESVTPGRGGGWGGASTSIYIGVVLYINYHTN